MQMHVSVAQLRIYLERLQASHRGLAFQRGTASSKLPTATNLKHLMPGFTTGIVPQIL